MTGQILLDETTHTYTYDGVSVPSVSEVLAPLAEEAYSRVNQSVREAAAARGRAVHAVCESIDYGIEPTDVDVELAPYIKAYTDFLRDYDPEWLAVEKTVSAFRGAREDGEPPLFCGTLDRYGLAGGQRVIVDIKTYSTMKSEQVMNAACQTALYKVALQQEFSEDRPIRRYVLHLRSDGTYRLISLDDWEYEKGFPAAGIAAELVHVCYHKRRLKDMSRRSK